MSVLSRVLRGTAAPGVHRWHSAWPAPAAAAAARRQGLRVAVLDGARLRTEADLHDVLARDLDLPEHYGRNLDALADVLRDLPPAVVLWDDAGAGGLPAARRALVERVLGERLPVLVRD
ncbi:barstar family protein [Nocardioides sp.]|uniref:barstar family protein n=1 Tax=Nocardioides sp. TaxID=35761 RepID=UPI003516BC66